MCLYFTFSIMLFSLLVCYSALLLKCIWNFGINAHGVFTYEVVKTQSHPVGTFPAEVGPENAPYPVSAAFIQVCKGTAHIKQGCLLTKWNLTQYFP